MHPKLVEKLMELEIPEIKSGTVEIKVQLVNQEFDVRLQCTPKTNKWTLLELVWGKMEYVYKV